jgi:abequosyltransferase
VAAKVVTVGIRLSICIPTYNRAHLLRELLESLTASDLKSIHVAISDNASRDNTHEIAEVYRERFPNFDYHRNEENLGPDRNYLAAANMARGEYCLLMGSDDVFMPGSIAKIFEYLKDEPDLLVYSRVDANFKLKPLRVVPAASFPTDPVRLQIRCEKDIVDYLDHCNSIGAAYSYLSSVVFRVDRWRAEKCPEIVIGSAYPHTAIFFAIMRKGCSLIYTEKPIVVWRGGNDTFLSGGMDKRVLLDLNGYDLLATTMFADQPEAAAALRRLVVREHTELQMRRFVIFLPRKLRTSHKGWEEVNRRLNELGTPGKRYRTLDKVTPIWLLPAFMRKLMLQSYLLLKRILF